MSNLEQWLKLSGITNIGSDKLITLVKRFGIEDVFRAPERDISSLCGVQSRTAAKIKEAGSRDVRGWLRYIEKNGIKVISFLDREYPVNLNEIYDPPVVLFVSGSLLPRDKNSIAVIGARKATPLGRKEALELSKSLASSGITIVSGLARGIDTEAHKGAISADGRTIAVLGSGIDVVYPSENMELFRKIRESGAVVTEYPPGTPPKKENFPRRNRIISGLSLGVIIVEAAEKSGSLITAGKALEQGREVFAVPGPIWSRNSAGVNNLIKDGAALLTSPAEVFEAVKFDREFLAASPPKSTEKPGGAAAGAEEKIMEILELAPLHIDELASRTGYKPGELAGLLINLEIKGLVQVLPGKMYCSNAGR